MRDELDKRKHGAGIKIIKRNREKTAENTAIEAQSGSDGARTNAPSPEAQSINLRGAVDVVKGWISERAANRRIEKNAAMHGLFKLRNLGT